jgi:hypothetical protein
VNSTSKQFALCVSKFQKLSSKDLQALYKLQQFKNFSAVIGFLDQSKLHDFTLFQTQAEVYLRLEKKEQIEACKSFLPRVALCDWNLYKNSIMASDQLLSDDSSLKQVKEKLNQVLAAEGIPPISIDIQKTLDQQWAHAFDQISQVMIIQEFKWQKELVCFLAYLIMIQSRLNILISLGTGHGKSVVIAMLSEILA